MKISLSAFAFRLDLDAWINEPPAEESSESEHEVEIAEPQRVFPISHTGDTDSTAPKRPEPTNDELERVGGEFIDNRC